MYEKMILSVKIKACFMKMMKFLLLTSLCAHYLAYAGPLDDLVKKAKESASSVAGDIKKKAIEAAPGALNTLKSNATDALKNKIGAAVPASVQKFLPSKKLDESTPAKAESSNTSSSTGAAPLEKKEEAAPQAPSPEKAKIDSGAVEGTKPQSVNPVSQNETQTQQETLTKPTPSSDQSSFQSANDIEQCYAKVYACEQAEKAQSYNSSAARQNKLDVQKKAEQDAASQNEKRMRDYEDKKASKTRAFNLKLALFDAETAETARKNADAAQRDAEKSARIAQTELEALQKKTASAANQEERTKCLEAERAQQEKTRIDALKIKNQVDEAAALAASAAEKKRSELKSAFEQDMAKDASEEEKAHAEYNATCSARQSANQQEMDKFDRDNANTMQLLMKNTSLARAELEKAQHHTSVNAIVGASHTPIQPKGDEKPNTAESTAITPPPPPASQESPAPQETKKEPESSQPPSDNAQTAPSTTP